MTNPTTITPKGIDHVCLWVTSLSAAKTYYESIFGVSCVPRPGVADTVVVEGKHIHFFIRQSDAHMADSLAMQHLAFSVESLDDVVTSLTALGIDNFQLGEVDCFSRGNYRWCEWADPDGIRLECVQNLR